MTQTHRPSFKSYCNDNAFYSISPDGVPTLDGYPLAYCPEWLTVALSAHERDGSHPDCVICQTSARRQWEANIEAQAADARDLQATYQSAL